MQGVNAPLVFIVLQTHLGDLLAHSWLFEVLQGPKALLENQEEHLLGVELLGRDVEPLASQLGILVQLTILREQEATLFASNENKVSEKEKSNVQV